MTFYFVNFGGGIIESTKLSLKKKHSLHLNHSLFN